MAQRRPRRYAHSIYPEYRFAGDYGPGRARPPPGNPNSWNVPIRTVEHTAAERVEAESALLHTLQDVRLRKMCKYRRKWHRRNVKENGPSAEALEDYKINLSFDYAMQMKSRAMRGIADREEAKKRGMEVLNRELTAELNRHFQRQVDLRPYELDEATRTRNRAAEEQLAATNARIAELERAMLARDVESITPVYESQPTPVTEMKDLEI